MNQQLENQQLENQQLEQGPTRSIEWAPWWLYLVIIVGANYLRRATFPDASASALRVVIALGFSAALFAAITLVFRAVRR